jgi:hypothetical protein
VRARPTKFLSRVGILLYEKQNGSSFSKCIVYTLKIWKGIEMEKINEFERVSDDVVLIDGKHYRAMSDDEACKFIWGDAVADGKCPVCGELKSAAALHEFCYRPEPLRQ